MNSGFKAEEEKENEIKLIRFKEKIMMNEKFYIKKCKQNGVKVAFRKVHRLTGQTVYGSDQGSYHGSGYRKQTLDLTDPNAHWEPPTP